MSVRATRSEGKSMFVKEHLNTHPEANHREVNEAWREAGFTGSISPTLVSRVRARLGLTGKSKGRGRSGSGARRGRPPGAASTTDRGRRNSLMALEVEIDHLLMKVAEIGTLPEVEDALRKTRRQLYAGLAAKD